MTVCEGGNLRPDESPSEEDIVWAYCNERELYRPGTTVFTALRGVLIFAALIALAAEGLQRLLYLPAVYAVLPSLTALFLASHSSLTRMLLYFFCSITGGCICSKMIVTGMVELYQQYAPEDMRRRCLLMPTCSEYMILAVQKYGVIRGVYKGINRLFTRYCGNVYRIDYP